jgi:hypothetical protein
MSGYRRLYTPGDTYFFTASRPSTLCRHMLARCCATTPDICFQQRQAKSLPPFEETANLQGDSPGHRHVPLNLLYPVLNDLGVTREAL